MKKWIWILLLVSAIPAVAGVLTLSDCYRKAEMNHPLEKALAQRRRILELNRSNWNIGWLPKLAVNLNATYTSDVLDFSEVMSSLPLQLPAGMFPETPKDQYKAVIEISQTLYDGGAVSAGKQLEQASYRADTEAIRVEIYQSRDQINQSYFALLALEKQKDMAGLFRDEISERRKVVLSGIRNGMVLPSTLDVLDAELLKIDQQLTEIELNQDKSRTVLASLIGEPVADKTLSLPEVVLPEDLEIVRPEVLLFEDRKSLIGKRENMLSVQRRPKLFAFGSYGYGKPPGTNFLHTEFDTYTIAGVGMTWSPFDWNTTRRSKQALSNQEHITETKIQNFKRNIRMALNAKQADIKRLNALLKKDEKLIRLREKIKQAAASKLDNGAISATEFLTELNAEREARISLKLHQIQKVEAQIQCLTLSGQMDHQEAREQ